MMGVNGKKMGRPTAKRNESTLKRDIATLARLRMSLEAHEQSEMSRRVAQNIDVLIADLRILQVA